MRTLGEQLTPQRLLQMLELLQRTASDLGRSSNRRTDAELCLIRMCDESLDASFAGLSARVSRLEERLAAGGLPAGPTERPPVSARTSSAPAPRKEAVPAPGASEAPSRHGQEDAPAREGPLVPQTKEPPKGERAPAVSEAGNGDEDRAFWPSFAAGLRGKVPPSVLPYLNNPAKVTGVWKNGLLTLWVDSEFTRSMLNKPAVLEGLTAAAAALFGGQPKVSVVTGQPPAREKAAPRPPEQERPPQQEGDALDELLAFGEYDNIVIQ